MELGSRNVYEIVNVNVS